MKDVLLNLANRELLKFCKENSIDPSGTHVEKVGRGFRYNLVQDDQPPTVVAYISVLFTKNSTPQFSMNNDAKAQRTEKIKKLRENMPGYILGDLTRYTDDSDVLEMCNLNNRHAEIHNMVLSRSKHSK